MLDGEPVQNVDGYLYIITLVGVTLVVFCMFYFIRRSVYGSSSKVKIVDTKGNFVKYE